ncbi:MAG TPA: hypothetical protein VIL78_16020 [Hanamia sp.]
MKLTKPKMWMIIEIAMAAFLIISSCREPGKTYTNNEKQLTRNLQPFFKTISFTNTFLIPYNIFIKTSSLKTYNHDNKIFYSPVNCFIF